MAASIDSVALLHQDFGDVLAVKEGQVNLAQIDVAEQHELVVSIVAMDEPPGRCTSHGHGDQKRDPDSSSHATPATR